MLLTAGSAFEFAKFIQVVSWIVLPIFCLTVAVTVWIHYRRKKKLNTSCSDDGVEQLIAAPETTAYKISDSEYIFFDHSAAVRVYKNKLVFNHARYTALRYDFNRLERKYSAVLKHTDNLSMKKMINMENSNGLLQHSNQSDADNAENGYEGERNELRQQLDELNKLYQTLEKDNDFLHDKFVLLTAGEDERNSIIGRWEDEHKALKDKIAEQEYLKDILEEKKKQIEFLQQQLEQRVRNYYDAEQKTNEANLQLSEAQKEVESLKNKLLLKQEEMDRSQMIICEKEEQLENNRQTIASKDHHIIVLERMLRETKQQNEILNAAVADGNDVAISLQEQLINEQAKRSSLEQKLESDQKILRRLHKEISEISSSVNTGEESPVIELKTAYANNEKREWDEKSDSIVIA